MLKNQSQEESIPEVMFPGGVRNPYNMTDHNCWKVDLLPPVQQVDEALIHGICKVVALTPWDDILYNELEEQLVYRCHVTHLDGLGCLQPCLLTQLLGEFQQPRGSKHGFVLIDMYIEANGRNTEYLTQFLCVKA